MLCFKDSALPQGAPTSPMLSNICFKKVDNTILSFCNKNNIIYTRYADDLTFSGDNFNIKNIIAIITQILKKNGYQINKQKTKVMRPGNKKIITGIIVNEKLSISRHLRRKLRAAINNINHGRQPHLNGENISLKQIQGYINYIDGISKEQACQLRKRLYANKQT